MRIARNLLATALVVGAALSVAAPANAVVSTFATFSSKTAARDVSFVNSGNSVNRLTDARFFTSLNGTTASAVAVNFSFLIPSLAPYVTNVTALYTYNATVAKGSPIASGVSGSPFNQMNLSGSFSFVTTSAITLTGPNFTPHTYAAGSNLLSGTFTAGNIVGTLGGTAGSTFASSVSGGVLVFTSDFLDFTNVVELDRATSLTSVNPKFSKHGGANGALANFRAVVGGQFSSDPVPVVNFIRAVPEPQSWVMMIAGFGMVGFAARRRTRAIAA